MAPLARRLFTRSTPAVWDFLAPTTSNSSATVHHLSQRHSTTQQSSTFSTCAEQCAPKPATSSARGPSQPASKGSSSPSGAQQPRPSGQNGPQGGPKPQRKGSLRKPARVHSASASSLELLSSIRNYAPPTAATLNTSSAVDTPTPFNAFVDPTQAHNQAVLSLISGAQSSQFAQAFTHGWLPLRRAQQIGRLKTEDLVRVLETCSYEMGRTSSKAQWSDVRELVLWLAGEPGQPWLDKWAQREVEKGPDGCARVVQVWEDLVAGEHLELRQGEEALDGAYKNPIALARENATAGSTAPLVSFRAYGSIIIAQSILNAQLPEVTRPSLRSLLPQLVHPRAPLLKPLLPYALPHLTPERYPTPAATLAHGQSWLRQVALAQRWSLKTGGLDIIRQFNADMRKGRTAEGWDTWVAVQEAVESPSLSWLGVEWKESDGKKWVDNREAELEAKVQAVEAGLDVSAEAPVEAPEPIPAEEGVEAEEVPARSRAPFHPDEARLTQAFVAPFLSAFAKLKLFTEANTIWVWLQDRGYTPGVTTWTGLLAGYASRGDVQAVESAWTSMLDAGIKPDAWAYLEHARAYFEAKRPDDATRIADQLLSDKRALALLGGKVPPLVYTTLIGGLLSNGRHDQAREILEQMGPEEVSVHTVNLFLRLHTQRKRPDFARIVECLRLISDRGLEPDVITFTMVLQALLTMGQADAPAKLIKIMEGMGVQPTVTTYGAIIHHLASTGKPDQLAAAVDVLNELEKSGGQTNEIIYTSLIQGFLRAIASAPRAMDDDGQHPYFRAALALKSRMDNRGLRLNRVGYNAIIASGLALHSDWGTDLALQAFRDLRGIKLAQRGEMGSNGETLTIADTWYVLLQGFAQQGDWSRAREVLAEMQRDRFEVRSGKLQRLVDNVVRGGWVR